MEHEADAVVAVGVPVAVLVLLGGNAVDDQVARIVMVKPAHDVQQRGLARARRPQDGHELVVAERHGHVVERHLGERACRVRLADMVQLKHGPTAFLSSAGLPFAGAGLQRSRRRSNAGALVPNGWFLVVRRESLVSKVNGGVTVWKTTQIEGILLITKGARPPPALPRHGPTATWPHGTRPPSARTRADGGAPGNDLLLACAIVGPAARAMRAVAGRCCFSLRLGSSGPRFVGKTISLMRHITDAAARAVRGQTKEASWTIACTNC